MTDILFYHLQRQPLEAVLPLLLRKTLEKKWRCIVESPSSERLKALDDHLWTFADDSFLPHGQAEAPDSELQPILLTTDQSNSNQANIRFLIEGASLPDNINTYERLIVLFDGNDSEALGLARQQWKQVKDLGLAATYWQQNDSSQWEKKA